jgi:hypothetical protein
MNYIGPNELIYNNDGGIHSGGFSVNSIMLKSGLSPIMTLNGNNNVNIDGSQMGGNKVSDLFNNLVIPSGFLSYEYKKDIILKGGDSYHPKKNDDDDYDDDDMHEDLHDKLLNLVKVDKTEMQNKSVANKKATKKNFNAGRKSKKNTTKKTTKIR